MLLGSVSFIGGGVMGEAVIQGILSKRLTSSAAIIVGEPRQERREELKQKYGIKVTRDNRFLTVSVRWVK
jgi:pyrroline-5-carboxylate reductase